MKKKVIIGTIAALLSVGMLSGGQNVQAKQMKASFYSYVFNRHGRKTGKHLSCMQRVNVQRVVKLHGRKYYQIGKNRYVHYGNLERVTYADQYKPKKKKDVTVTLVHKGDGYGAPKHYRFTNPKNLVKNASKLPRGTKFKYDKINKPCAYISDSIAGNQAEIDIIYPDKSVDYVEFMVNYRIPIDYGIDKITLPSAYTAQSIAKAVSDPTSLAQAADKGNKENKYLVESKKDLKEKVDINHLTDSQKQRISEFALKLINGVRTQLGRPSWYYTADAQKLADDVATEYQENGRGVQDEDHYVPGLVRAANKNGYDIDGINQIEDMAGQEYHSKKAYPSTMSELKELVYDNVKSFLFGGDEFSHCADITSCHPEGWWNDTTMTAPFAISVSTAGKWVSVHYISIPSDILATKQN